MASRKGSLVANQRHGLWCDWGGVKKNRRGIVRSLLSIKLRRFQKSEKSKKLTSRCRLTVLLKTCGDDDAQRDDTEDDVLGY